MSKGFYKRNFKVLRAPLKGLFKGLLWGLGLRGLRRFRRFRVFLKGLLKGFRVPFSRVLSGSILGSPFKGT